RHHARPRTPPASPAMFVDSARSTPWGGSASHRRSRPFSRTRRSRALEQLRVSSSSCLRSVLVEKRCEGFLGLCRAHSRGELLAFGFRRRRELLAERSLQELLARHQSARGLL